MNEISVGFWCLILGLGGGYALGFFIKGLQAKIEYLTLQNNVLWTELEKQKGQVNG